MHAGETRDEIHGETRGSHHRGTQRCGSRLRGSRRLRGSHRLRPRDRHEPTQPSAHLSRSLSTPTAPLQISAPCFPPLYEPPTKHGTPTPRDYSTTKKNRGKLTVSRINFVARSELFRWDVSSVSGGM